MRSSVWGDLVWRWQRSWRSPGKEVIVVDNNENKVKELRVYTDYAYVAGELTRKYWKIWGFRTVIPLSYASAKKN